MELRLAASWLNFERVDRDLLKALIYSNYLLSPRRSFWSFDRVPDSAFLFQMRRGYMLDAICECYAMHDFARKKMSMHWINFIYPFFIKPATFSNTPLHGSVISISSSFFRKYFCLDARQSCCIPFFYSRKQTPFLVDSPRRKHWTFHPHALDFTNLTLSINPTWIMKNH